MSQNSQIIKDFTEKQKSYFQMNYETPTKQNFLRRIRREKIESNALAANNIDRVLDLGCGPAILYQEVLSKCKSYTVVDLVPANLDEIKQNQNDDRIKYICDNVDDLDLGENEFDIIICSGSLEYSRNPIHNIQKLCKSLAPGGRFIVSLAQFSSPYRIWSEYVYFPLSRFVKRCFGKNPSSYGRKLCSVSAVRNVIVRQKRIEIVDWNVQYLGYKLIPSPLDNLFESFDHFVVKKLQSITPSLLNWTCIEFLLSFDKKST